MIDQDLKTYQENDQFENMLLAEQRRLIGGWGGNEKVSLFSTIALSAFICYGNGNDIAVLVWAAIMLFGVNTFSPRTFDKVSDRNFLHISTVAVAIGACAWVILPFLVPHASEKSQLFLLFIITLVIVVKSMVSCYNPPELYVGIGIGCGGLSLWQATLINNNDHLQIALALLLLGIALIGFGRLNYKGLLRMVKLSMENFLLAQSMQQKAAELAQANLAKTRFLASASHDLRQPLHAVGLFVGLLESRVTDTATHQIVRHIENSVEAMDGLLNSILNISKLDAGVENPQIAPVSIQNMWLNLERNFATTAYQNGLELRLRKSGLWVASDEHLLLRILNNLLSNAIRYTKTGGVLVAARQRGNQVTVEIWDTGIGIPHDRQRDVFQEFVQLHNTERDRTKGLGLGLSIVQRTADLLGHHLDLYSQPNKGTLIRLTLPRIELPRALSADRTSQTKPDVAGLFVLFVDDEKEVRFAMQALLTDWGCSVVTAANSEEALAQVCNRLRPPDVLVLDYRLPGETGVTLAKHIKQNLEIEIPTLIVTGDVTPAPLKEIEQSGFPVHHKPVNPARLREWMGRHRSQ